MLMVVPLDVLVLGLWWRLWFGAYWCVVGFGLGLTFWAQWSCVGVVLWGLVAVCVGVVPHVLRWGWYRGFLRPAPVLWGWLAVPVWG